MPNFTIVFRDKGELVVEAADVGWAATEGSTPLIYFRTAKGTAAILPADIVRAVYETDARKGP
jgi:hypothetical protein